MSNQRIVVVAPNWLGDIVMALPAIRDVRSHFGQASMTVAARASVSKVFRAVNGVDEILTLASKGGELEQLKAGKFDVAILLPNSFRSAWLVHRASIPERWGYRSDFRSPLLTKAVRRPRPRVHFGVYYQELVRQLGIATGPLTPRIDVPAVLVESSRRLLIERGWSPERPLIGIAPGAAFGHAKRWSPKHFASLMSSLRQQLDAQCVLLGSPDDRDASHAIEARLAGNMQSVINLVGQTDLLAFMGVIASCRALVANDSGALHVAAAIGIPVVAIYGPTSERFSTPLTRQENLRDRVVTVSENVFCRPCWLRDCPIDHRCMTRVAPERVYAIVRQFLQEGSHA